MKLCEHCSADSRYCVCNSYGKARSVQFYNEGFRDAQAGIKAQHDEGSPENPYSLGYIEGYRAFDKKR
jgi:hypothetical protein